MSFYLSSTLKNLLVKLYKDWDLLQFNIIEGIDEMKMDWSVEKLVVSTRGYYTAFLLCVCTSAL